MQCPHAYSSALGEHTNAHAFHGATIRPDVTSGSSGHQHFARVQDVVRGERLLQAPHQGKFLRPARPGEISPLLESNAMLGRDRTAAGTQSAVDCLFHGVSRLVATITDPCHDVKVAVAQVAEDNESELRP